MFELISEINDFLTPDECDHFISTAEDIGMKQSYTEKQSRDGVRLMDLDRDQHLDLTEVVFNIVSLV